MQPERLRVRILTWAEQEARLGTIPAQAGQVLEAVLYRGQLLRGEIPGLLGVGERQARRVVSPLLEKTWGGYAKITRLPEISGGSRVALDARTVPREN